MRTIVALIGVAALCAAAGLALASRNSSGTYSTPNTFVTGTSISSTAMNSNFSDIATEMTDSLDRSGKGGMLAAVRGVDGTVAAPAYSYTSETGTGFYRIGANDLGLGVGGSKRHEWTTAGEFAIGNFGIGAAAADPFDITVAGSASGTVSTWLQASLADGNNNAFYVGKALGAGQAGILTYTKNATAANSTWCMGVFGGAADTLCVDGNNKAYSNGSLTIGASGTAISGSFRGTTTWNPGTLGACGAGPCATASTTITVTGAAAGADCIAGVADPAPLSGYTPQCIVTLNTCSLELVNQSNVSKTFGSATFWCRVFNP